MGRAFRLALAALGVLGSLAWAPAASVAADFTVIGRFQYEDRLWNKDGFTGAAQTLPIRHADVEVVRASNGQVLATGSTETDGDFSILVTGLTGTVGVYVRCKSSTDYAADYHIKVVDTFVRTGGTVSLTGSTIWSITTGTFNHNTSIALLDAGTWLTQDGTGFGVTQTFNVLDQAVDTFDYLATANGIGRFPTPSEFIVYGWDGPSSDPEGSNYSSQGIFLESKSTNPADTDAWSDMVILHETGHWGSDMFGRDDNVGGPHFIGDNVQDPRLSYGEGYATFFAAQVREFRSSRLNGVGQPVDSHVSLYADLGPPPALPGVGGLEFCYDFETGLFNSGVAIGQIGTANETNVTSAMWDLIDGTGTPDESPGSDDEPGDEAGPLSWEVVQEYMTSLTPPNWITVEDFYRGWFVRHGPGFMQTEVDSAFAGLGRMPFREDALEPDDEIESATLAAPGTYSVSAGGKVVVNELDLGSEDKVELLNTKDEPVDVSGWTLTMYWAGGSLAYVILPGTTIDAGGILLVHENGSASLNSGPHVYIGVNGNINWANLGNGAVTLSDATTTARDFVRWGGNTTPVPPGTGFTGALASAPAGKTLARNGDGTDTDDASDFTAKDPTPSWPNLGGFVERTIAPELNPDVYRLDLAAGDLMVVRAESHHSAGEPIIDLLDSAGNLIAQETSTYGIRSQAELQFFANTDRTVYARLNHAGLLTEFAALRPAFYLRPVADVLSPPVGVVAQAANVSDTGDPVPVTWLNGADYDSVRVYRDGAPLATLPGDETDYYDAADRGPHLYTVQGQNGTSVTTLAEGPTFAGILECSFADELEAGTAPYLLHGSWNTTGANKSSGSFSLTDSPGGNYLDNLDVSAEILVPTRLVSTPELRFKHICVTEATFDFGIVEISTDFGAHWTEVARYDMDDYPEWNDGVAGPGDWKSAVIDLGAYVGKKVRIRFRLTTDVSVVEDGWYLDEIAVSDPTCEDVIAVGDDPGLKVPLLALRSNPFREQLHFTVRASAGRAARVDLFDLSGRRVRRLWDGPLTGGRLDLVWDGRDDGGRHTASGLYFLRAQAGGRTAVERALKLP